MSSPVWSLGSVFRNRPKTDFCFSACTWNRALRVLLELTWLGLCLIYTSLWTNAFAKWKTFQPGNRQWEWRKCSNAKVERSNTPLITVTGPILRKPNEPEGGNSSYWPLPSTSEQESRVSLKTAPGSGCLRCISADTGFHVKEIEIVPWICGCSLPRVTGEIHKCNRFGLNLPTCGWWMVLISPQWLPCAFCLPPFCCCLLFLHDLPLTFSSSVSLVISPIWQLQPYKSSLTGKTVFHLQEVPSQKATRGS